jgi:16S rRNA (guanine1516-N2)-methyltransferase
VHQALKRPNPGVDAGAAGIVALAAASDDRERTQMRMLARTLGLPLVDALEPGVYKYLLVRTPERLELRANGAQRARPCYVDLCALAARALKNISRRHPLVRAVGVQARSVIDATAGFGQDALLLAAMGYQVMALERSPVVAALLDDGLARLLRDGRLRKIVGDRLSVLAGDARDLVPQLRPQADVIYLDPMYPPKRRRSALARKHVRVLRELVGDDEDAAELLQICRQHARRRVVVKRPHYAPPLSGNPTVSYQSKLVRYDVYVTAV